MWIFCGDLLFGHKAQRWTVILCLLHLPLSPSWGKNPNAEDGIVHALTGPWHSSSAQLADDLRQIIGERHRPVRLSPVIGDGDFSNVADILSLETIDLAFIQIDVLNHYEMARIDEDIKEKLHYITKTHNKEVHVIAKAYLENLRNLSGKIVNLGPQRDGSYITGTEIFAALGIEFTATTHNHSKAYERLKAGEIDAMVVVDGRPSQIVKLISLDDGVRLLPIPLDGLPHLYSTSQFTNEEYPHLIPVRDVVKTISVPTVLASYSWPAGTLQREKLDAFIEALFDALPTLRFSAGFHPKWREVDTFGRVIGGWQRHHRAIELGNPLRRFQLDSKTE